MVGISFSLKLISGFAECAREIRGGKKKRVQATNVYCELVIPTLRKSRL